MARTELRVLELAPGETHRLECGEYEWIVLPLAGACAVHSRGAAPEAQDDRVAPEAPDDREAPEAPDDREAPDEPGALADPPQVFELRGRADVFAAVTDFAYLPRGGGAAITSPGGGRFALAGARTAPGRRLTARYGPAERVPVELRGAGSCSRQVNNFAAAGVFDCDRLIAVEVLTPGGNWSSYPPHKHDEHHPGAESELEEIYYYEIAPHGDTPGLGYQRVSPSPAGKTDILTEVRTGDAVLIPDGWHGPSIAAPGHDMYYLNVMAGPGETREWLIRDHPDHGWIRDTWPGQAVDPRLPFTTDSPHRSDSPHRTDSPHRSEDAR
ncbi:5-deoxy-glucuronate isomerase [Streptomyces sp. NBC_00536]|uniref:5-deoxy-glucuronate isomerase n=1 Tax=Streptomyces sp. NBC_00536 TaxID=2975769 RepID=UPI002E80245C|nr:5-deoxy-glucuronate isomerase [Streptomyces sp. NBC_00536]WUC79161.1 5-deoxy-glucuronate isomerase [Streptomyces sp. NBC_00536]